MAIGKQLAVFATGKDRLRDVNTFPWSVSEKISGHFDSRAPVC